MSKDTDSKAKEQPGTSREGNQARAARDARLADALRANLQRRKAQTRGRKASGAPAPQSDSD